MKTWLAVFIIIFALGCQKQKNIIVNEEEPVYAIDKEGNILENKPIKKISFRNIHNENTPKTQIAFQSNRLIINFQNGSSLIFQPIENPCNEWELEKPLDNCQEEYFLAAICKDEDNNTIICSNDTFYWEFNIQITQTKEGIDSTQFKIKKLKNQKKSLQGKMVLEDSKIPSNF